MRDASSDQRCSIKILLRMGVRENVNMSTLETVLLSFPQPLPHSHVISPLSLSANYVAPAQSPPPGIHNPPTHRQNTCRRMPYRSGHARTG